MQWRDVDELLIRYPGLRLIPSREKDVVIRGTIAFQATHGDREVIADEYEVELVIHERFPESVPSIRELGGRIPDSFHKLAGGGLCLGSPTRLRIGLVQHPTVLGFVEQFVVPYLYGHSYFIKHGEMPFSELSHGPKGLLEDLASIFDVEDEEAGQEMARLASKTRRVANKAPCPCGSGRRLGRCHHRRVNQLRRELGTRWFREVSRGIT